MEHCFILCCDHFIDPSDIHNFEVYDKSKERIVEITSLLKTSQKIHSEECGTSNH